MLDWDWLIKVEHIYREGNRPTDYLIGLGHSLLIGVHDISVSNLTFSLHLLYDFLELSQFRSM
ncbi:hypothetical protein LINGRAHAP2_LOCUS32586 [Linum grandiflorum]